MIFIIVEKCVTIALLVAVLLAGHYCKNIDYAIVVGGFIAFHLVMLILYIVINQKSKSYSLIVTSSEVSGTNRPRTSDHDYNKLMQYLVEKFDNDENLYKHEPIIDIISMYGRAYKITVTLANDSLYPDICLSCNDNVLATYVDYVTAEELSQ